jgi:hypothetical protein
MTYFGSWGVRVGFVWSNYAIQPGSTFFPLGNSGYRSARAHQGEVLPDYATARTRTGKFRVASLLSQSPRRGIR